MRPKNQKKRCREDIEARLERAAEGEEEFDLDFDEVTDVIDIALARTKRVSEEAQAMAQKTIDTLRKIAGPTADPSDG
jgi:ppGpp synthetase/RelA/SpoT-type nucleotidyltranferase